MIKVQDNIINSMENYFQLFNLPEAYSVDLELLAKNYRTVQAEVHPDRFADANSADKRTAIQYSSMVNDAKDTLQSPLKRAVYLLKLNNVELNFERDTRFDENFLMEQIDLREQLEEQHDLPGLRQVLESRQQQIISDLVELFDNKKWQEAKEEVKKLMFFLSLEKELKG